MANNFYPDSMLAEYSLNLLRGQMISQLIGSQGFCGMGGLSLTEYILGKPKATRRSGTDMMNDALTGLMRSDAAMLRQASKNMLQGKALLATGSEGIKSIQEKLKRMGEIANRIKISGGATSQQKAEYDALASEVKAIIEGTSFNGISLFDGEAWQKDERVNILNGIGKISLQAGDASTELNLYDLKEYKKSLTAADLDSVAGVNNVLSEIALLESLLEGMSSSYGARAGLLDSEAATFERQAGILDEATGQAKPGDEESLKQALVDILMRDTGALVNSSS